MCWSSVIASFVRIIVWETQRILFRITSHIIPLRLDLPTHQKISLRDSPAGLAKNQCKRLKFDTCELSSHEKSFWYIPGNSR